MKLIAIEGVNFPPRHWNRLQKMVWNLRHHGNSPANLNLDVLAYHNQWTDKEAILAEFKMQENGGRKLPEEVAANAPPPLNYDDSGEGK